MNRIVKRNLAIALSLLIIAVALPAGAEVPSYRLAAGNFLLMFSIILAFAEPILQAKPRAKSSEDTHTGLGSTGKRNIAFGLILMPVALMLGAGADMPSYRMAGALGLLMLSLALSLGELVLLVQARGSQEDAR